MGVRAGYKDWTAEEDEALRLHSLLKTPGPVVADQFGVSVGAIQTRMTRLGASQQLTQFQRDRIVELRRDEKYRPSRIAQRVGVSQDQVAVVLQQAGFEVATDRIPLGTVVNARKKLSPGHRFTEAEDETIRSRMLAGHSLSDIARDLGLKRPAVANRASGMGLKVRAMASERAAAGLLPPPREPKKEIAVPTDKSEWTAGELAGLEKLWAEGKDSRQIAKILNRGVLVIDREIEKIKRKHRVVISDQSAGYSTQATKARVLELHAQGATTLRISRIVPMTTATIDLLLRKEGLEPNVVSKSGAGRYGVEMPLPAPRDLDAEPLKLLYPSDVPRPAAVDEIVEAAPEVVHEVPETPAEQAPEPDEIPAAEPEVVQQPQLEPEQEIAMPAVATEQNPFGRPWSDEDLAYLAAADAEGKGLDEVAAHLGRTVTAVKKKRTLEHAAVRVPTRTVSAPGLVVALDTEIAAVEERIAAEQKSLKLMRDLRSTLDGARAA